MKSLEVKALEKIPELQRKTLLEILEMTEDGNNPKSALYSNILFKSRDSLFAIFDSYLRDEGIAFFQASFAEQRSTLKRLLRSRRDVITSSQCRDFFVALARGFMWDYVVARRTDASDDDMSELHPYFGFHENQYGLSEDVKIRGTLPGNTCQGVLFLIQIYIDDGMSGYDTYRETSYYVIWDTEVGLIGDNKIKFEIFHDLLATGFQRQQEDDGLVLPEKLHWKIDFGGIPGVPDGAFAESEGASDLTHLPNEVADAIIASGYDFTIPPFINGDLGQFYITMNKERVGDGNNILQFVITSHPFTV